MFLGKTAADLDKDLDASVNPNAFKLSCPSAPIMNEKKRNARNECNEMGTNPAEPSEWAEKMGMIQDTNL